MLLAAVIALAAGTSCSVTRRIPDGQYLLKSNSIEADPATPRKERITAGELDRYVLQSPNRHFLGTNLYAWLHEQADPEKDTGWHRFLRRAGEEPVVWNPGKTTSSVDNLRTYIASRGFFSGEASVRVDTLRRKKVKVTYTVTQGPSSRIGKIRYSFRDTLLRDLVMADSAATLLRSGDIFDTGTMDRERVRIADNLRNKGYYNFNVGHITYIADSTGSTRNGRVIDINMLVRRNLEGYNEDGSAIYGDHRVYRLGEIYIHSDYDPLRDGIPGVSVHRDTVKTRGLNIIHDGRQEVWSRLLRRAVRLRKGELYSASDVATTSSELMRWGTFRSVSVVFEPVPGTGVLNCMIRCVPAQRHSIGVDFEASTAETFYGLRATLGYQNRNAFRGAELFDASITTGFEFMKATEGERKLSYELGANASITFPRFVFWAVESNPKVQKPISMLALSANWQDRAYYSRTLFGFSWGYSWGMRRFENFTLRPFDVNLVRMGHLAESFVDLLGENRYLLASYNDQMIAGISASYVYNDQPRNLAGGATVLRVNAETTGNLFSGLVRLFDQPAKQVEGEKEHYNIFGLRFSQYVRGDVSFSQKFMLGDRTALAYRVQGGAIYSYGNSSSPPFDKLFFAGGVNSMRGWAVRTLGPGMVPEFEEKPVYPAQMGDVKLEANVELRFPVMRQFGAALFFDAGNIWYMRSKPDEYSDAAVFRPKTFLKQLALDGGIGARIDIGVVVLRLDWGIQLHSPGMAAGKRWIHQHKFNLKNTALSFGVGHPF